MPQTLTRPAIGLDQKQEAKAALQVESHWPKEAKIPVICLPLGMTDNLGGKLLEETLPGILALSNELLILGKGSSAYGALFTKLTKEESHRVRIMQNDSASLEKIYLASDMALFFAPASDAELTQCLRHGVVPIAPESQILDDYNPVQESGNAFTYQKENVWHVFASLVRAAETFKFPYDWRTIQRHCLEQ